VAAALGNMYRLADRDNVNLKGIVTWAFEFEDKPYFAGYRDLATNGIDKPVLNLFRLAGLMSGDRVAVKSSAAIAPEKIISDDVRKSALVDAIATRSMHDLSILVWHYRDDDVDGPAASVQLNLAGLPQSPDRMLVKHYRIDKTHSNAFTAWKHMGSPEKPTAEEYSRLEAAGDLELLESPRWITLKDGRTTLPIILPLQAVSLLQLSW
jgi:xylan 1,4-beta-xylosidase